MFVCRKIPVCLLAAGPIPRQLGHLAALRHLSLRENQLNGEALTTRHCIFLTICSDNPSLLLFCRSAVRASRTEIDRLAVRSVSHDTFCTYPFWGLYFYFQNDLIIYTGVTVTSPAMSAKPPSVYHPGDGVSTGSPPHPGDTWR